MGCCGERACLKKEKKDGQSLRNKTTVLHLRPPSWRLGRFNSQHSQWFPTGPSGAAPQRHAVAGLRHNTDTEGFFISFFISNIRSYGVVFINISSMTTFHWFALWQQKAAYRRRPAVFSFFTLKAYREAYSVQHRVQYIQS